MKRIRQNSFIQNVFVLTSGTFIAQVITMLSTMLLGRIFIPAEFGDLTLFVSITGILIVIASLRYELSIVLPKKDDEAFLLLIWSIFLAGVWSVGAIGLLLILSGWLEPQLSGISIGTILWMSPVFIFSQGAYQALNYWATRQKQFRRLSISQVFRAAATALTQIGAGVAGMGVFGLIGGLVLGQVVALIVLAYQTLRDDGAFMRQNVYTFSTATAISTAKQYRQFPIYSTPQALLNSTSQNIPVFLLAHFFGADVVGYYGLAHRLLKVPSMLVGKAVQQVLSQRASEVYNRGGDLLSLTNKAILGLLTLGILPALLVVALGPEIFVFLLGEQWAMAGQYSQWLIIWLFVGFVNTPNFVIILIINKLRLLVIWDMAQIILRIVAICIGGFLLNDLLSIALYSLVGAVFYGFIILTVQIDLRARRLRNAT